MEPGPLYVALYGFNKQFCDPPLPDHEVQSIARSIGSKPSGVKALPVLSLQEMLDLPKTGWLIEGVLPDDGLAVVCGPPGHYKTFVVLDGSLSIASGMSWHGRPVRRRPVVYVAAEGAIGYRPRIQSWLGARGCRVDQIGIHFIPKSVQLLTEQEMDAFLLALQSLPEPPGLVVLDTLARCFVGGEENSAKDMGLLVAAAERIRSATGAVVLLVHHTGHNGNLRGSTALPGALQTIVGVRRRKRNLLEVSCHKTKDAEEFEKMYLAWEAHGESGILVPVSAPAGRDGKLTTNQKHALSALLDGPLGYVAWREASAVQKGSWDKSVKALQQTAFVTKKDGQYEITAAGREALARLPASGSQSA
jgi:hypothetical protein